MRVLRLTEDCAQKSARSWLKYVLASVSVAFAVGMIAYEWFCVTVGTTGQVEGLWGECKGDGPYSLFWGNDGVAMECGLLAKLPESDVLFCAKEAASAGGGQTFWFAARNMYVTWRCAGDGRCSQIAMQYNDAPLMEDLTGEGRFKDTVSPKPQGASALRDMPIPK